MNGKLPILIAGMVLVAALGSITYLAATKILTSDAILGLTSAIIASAAGIGGATASASGSNGTARRIAEHEQALHRELL